jgi:hypothetical protein
MVGTIANDRPLLAVFYRLTSIAGVAARWRKAATQPES